MQGDEVTMEPLEPVQMSTSDAHPTTGWLPASAVQSAFVPLAPRAYHINQGAIDVCNGLGMQPADAIVWLKGELGRKTETRDLRVQLEDAFRKVAQTEGVMLHREQKEFFKDLFAAMMAEVKKDGEDNHSS